MAEIVELLKVCEGFSSEPYLCPAGVPTIGYGTTYYPDGRVVTMEDHPVSQVEAEAFLTSHVEKLRKALESLNLGELNKNKQDALISFIYNFGIGAFTGSTLIKLIRENPNSAKIAPEFLKWVNVTDPETKTKAPSNGLVIRRCKEVALYFR